MGSLWLCGTGCGTKNIVWYLDRKGLDALSGLSQNRFLLYKSGHSVQEDCSVCMFLPVLDVLGLSVFSQIVDSWGWVVICALCSGEFR